MPWIHSYKPKDAGEAPQKKAVAALDAFVRSFSKQKKKAALLYGPVGCGKTSAVHALANTLGHELVETNASDTRDASAIEERIGAASKQASLFGCKKILLVDEIDGLSGSNDRGGVTALANVIEGTKFPIILTANDPWDQKLAPLRKKSVLIECEALDVVSVTAVLQIVALRENLITEELALKGIARRAGGDLRAAINDLETLAVVNKSITKDRLAELEDRNKEDSMIEALTKVLKPTDPAIALTAFETITAPIDTCLLWLDENIPVEYKKAEDLKRAYMALSKADVFFGRIRRWQHWRFLTYMSVHMTAGVATAKNEKYRGLVQYNPPGRILARWIALQKWKRKKNIAEKLATVISSSERLAMQEYLPYLPFMIRAQSFADRVERELELDPEEISWLKEAAKP